MAIKQAAALRYKNDETAAPRVVAIGQGQAAERIVSLAREYGVPVVENVEVVGKLVHMPPGQQIPPQLYEAVARILAFVYRLNKSK